MWGFSVFYDCVCRTGLFCVSQSVLAFLSFGACSSAHDTRKSNLGRELLCHALVMKDPSGSKGRREREEREKVDRRGYTRNKMNVLDVVDSMKRMKLL